MVSVSLAVASECKGTGVTVTVLCPGPTRTGFDRVAGLQGSRLFSGSVMPARDVALAGYRGMMQGKTEIIAGSRNRWSILLTRLAPRTMLADFAKRLNSDRSALQ